MAMKDVQYNFYLQKHSIPSWDDVKIWMTAKKTSSDPCVGRTSLGDLGSFGSCNC